MSPHHSLLGPNCNWLLTYDKLKESPFCLFIWGFVAAQHTSWADILVLFVVPSQRQWL